jgi:hypothetical protein
MARIGNDSTTFTQRNNMNTTHASYTTYNPFNNVLMSDYKFNIDKTEAPLEYTPEIENKINETTKLSILEQNKDNADMIYMFSDNKTNFEFEQSMRQFNSNPSTTIPNKQDGFLKFCYGELYSEKPLTIY